MLYEVITIALIQEIGNDNISIHTPKENPIGIWVNDTLNDIKSGKIDDKFNWITKVER